MSNMADTSLQAFHSLDLQAAEAEVLAAIRQHFGDGRKFTRAELADAMGWKINRITGRVLSLIERGLLEESETTIACPVTGGNAHQVWLIDYTRGVPQSNAVMAASRLPSQQAGRDCGTTRGSGAPETHGQAGKRGLVAVRPYIPGRWSLSIGAAKQIVKDPANAFIEEARKVITSGPHWVTG